MEKTHVGGNNRVTIPQDEREEFGINPGDKLFCFTRDNELVFKHEDDVENEVK